MVEILGFLAYNLSAAIFGVLGAYRGVIKKRNSMVSGWELSAIFLVSWLLGSIISFLLLVFLAVVGIPASDQIGLAVALIIVFAIARRMIEHRERIKGLSVKVAQQNANHS